MPSLKSIRVYHAHSASISALSISPYPPPLVLMKSDPPTKAATDRLNSSSQSTPKGNKDKSFTKGPKSAAVPLIPSNAIYIGSSSIDGNVCIQALTDSKDVILRGFGRPVQALGLSPDYKSDRSFLSGGLAGSLVLTSGGQIGTRSIATTAGTAASASGWLGSIGLGSNIGKDQVLHSGEGAISTIKWSLSGKYVVWVNEQGIKIMRSNLHLEPAESNSAWKRISHIDHPNRPGWDEMAGIWKAHVEWIDESGLESDHLYFANGSAEKAQEPPDIERLKDAKQSRRVEKLVVGWSGTIWIINVRPGSSEIREEAGERKLGRAEVITM